MLESAQGRRHLAVFALMFNAFVWGVSWWPFRALHEQGLHPLWSTALIYLVALACLLAVRPGAWRGFGRQPLLWLLVAAAGMTNVGFNWAVTIGDVVRVVLLFYLMPAWSVLLAWLLLGEKPTPLRLARLLLALAGVAVVLKAPGTPWPLPESLADWLALMGGLSFALTNILLRKLSAVPEPTRILAMFGGGTVLALAAGALGLAQGMVAAPHALALQGTGIAIALALFFLGGNIALQYGAARLPAHTTALVMLSEVVFASVSSVLLGAAGLDARTLAGGALILAAAAWSAWPGRRESAESVLPQERPMTTVYDFEARTITGAPAPLAQFKGKVLLIVNTASACGFTPQFGGLEELHKAYAGKGLAVLGFPSNQFGAQDPGSNEEIASFCQLNYGVSFPMMAKIDVKGDGADPLFQWLTKEAPGLLGSKAIKWNFTKFLVGKDGAVIRRYAPLDKPEALAKDIEAALAA